MNSEKPHKGIAEEGIDGWRAKPLEWRGLGARNNKATRRWLDVGLTGFSSGQ
jgi:hypothetical protein